MAKIDGVLEKLFKGKRFTDNGEDFYWKAPNLLVIDESLKEETLKLREVKLNKNINAEYYQIILDGCIANIVFQKLGAKSIEAYYDIPDKYYL